MTMPSTSPQRFTVTHGGVLKIAVPMTLAYLTVPIVGLVDMAVIGQLGVPALLGGVAIGAIIFDAVFSTFNFLRSGTTGFTAQALGAQDLEEQNAVVLRALILAILGGLILLALQWPILETSLYLMGAEPAVEAATRDYFGIRILSAPFALANFAILGWYLGLGRAGIGLLLQVLLNGINIALSITFVLGLHWGVAGIAWATVTGETCTAFLGMVLISRRLGAIGWPLRSLVLAKDRLIRMVAVNGDIMIRSFSLLAAFAFFTAQGARSGELVLAGNAVLMNFLMLGGYFLDGFAVAAEQLAGRAVGARWRPAFERTVRLTLIWGLCVAALLSAVFWLAGPVIIDTMTTSDAVRQTARTFLVWAALTPIAGVLAFQMDGIFIGATWSRDMRNMMLLSLAAYLAAWWLLVPVYGNHGLWMALLIFLGLRGFSLLWRCRVRTQSTFGGDPVVMS